MQRARAAVGGVVAAFEQAARLERVDERDHAAGRDLQALADRLLGLALGGAHRAQQRELARFELQRREDLVEASADRIADRGEHEADRLEGRVGDRRRGRVGTGGQRPRVGGVQPLLQAR